MSRSGSLRHAVALLIVVAAVLTGAGAANAGTGAYVLTATNTGSAYALRRISHLTVIWGRAWPAQPKPNVHPPAGPVTVVRASSYTVEISTDGRRWRTVARVTGARRGTVDVARFRPTRARFARLRMTQGTGSTEPMLQELTLTG